jgi:hypothetical protein
MNTNNNKQRLSSKTSYTKRIYAKPVVYYLGALEQVQSNSQGNKYDAASTTYLYYE